MNSDALPKESSYDWPTVRKWCISFLQAFLKHSDHLDTRPGGLDYAHALEDLPPLRWKKLESTTDGRIRYIPDTITACIDEAADKKSALPGMFNDAVIGARRLLAVLEQDLPLELVSKEVQRIADAM